MTKLYLVRHGETIGNAKHIMQGQTQGALNFVGRRQAIQLALRLESEGIDAFVSSDLRRAVETAEIIADRYGAKIETTPLLRERDWGGFTGKYIPTLQDAVWPDDIESVEDLKRRAGNFLVFIRERYPGLKVLAVGHGIVNKAVQSVYFGKPMSDIPRMANCEVRVLEL